MSTNPEEAPWQHIARRKRAAQRTALHTPSSISITVPVHLLPNDPPTPQHGPQPVQHIPEKLLSTQDNQITSLSVPSLLSKLRDGSLSATAATEAFIRRASIAHQLTNCLTEPLFERALERARQLDERVRSSNNSSSSNSSSNRLLPLHGLPISVKDTFNIAGVDSTTGLATFCFKPAATSSPLVTLLEDHLGCIIIAKTNVPQTMASLDSINNVFGRTYNPINRLLTAGGSSGGEGVLVAMKGCALGWGTDIGGSIRIPAACNGVYGFKPSEGRVPYSPLQGTSSLEGLGRSSVQAVAGPIARSVEDLRLVMDVVARTSWMVSGDCLMGDAVGWGGGGDVVFRGLNAGSEAGKMSDLQKWKGRGSGPNGEFVIGVLRSDGNCQLLPPVRNVMDEVADALRSSSSSGKTSDLHLSIRVVDIPTPPAWTKCQSVMSKLMGVDGSQDMSKWLLETNEPLVPWMKTRFKHGGKPVPLERVAELQVQRARLESEMIRHVWMFGSKERRTVDAVICPLVSHPIPEIDRWNAVGYTSSWVLLDYPAGVVPVRDVREADLELGRPLDEKLKVLGSWDVKSRELWDEKITDRKVYLGSTLTVQCVTAKLEDERLGFVMGVVDEAVKRSRGSGRADGGDNGGRRSKL